MKKKLVMLSILCCVMVIGACGMRRESASDAVTNLLKAIQKEDEGTVEKYLGEDLDLMEFDEPDNLEFEELLPLFLKHMSFNVVESKESEDNATVTVDITNVNMQKVMGEYLAKYLEYYLPYAVLAEGQQPTDAEISAKSKEILTGLINDSEAEKLTKTVILQLSYLEKHWKIEVTEGLVDGVFGGLVTFLNALENESTEIGIEDKIFEIRQWFVQDIWNEGFVTISTYLTNGTDVSGGKLDIEWVVSQLDQAMEKKKEYDTFMSEIPVEYDDEKVLWTKVSEQIEIVYAEVKASDLVPNKKGLDTTLLNQYFEAFDDEVLE